MTAMTNYLEKALLDHCLGKAEFTFPTEVWLALFTADPTETGSLSNEVSAGGYARVSLTALMNAAHATTGVAANASVINFGPASADWGTVTHTMVMDDDTAGNGLLYGMMTSSRVIQDGDSLQFAAGQYVITFA